MRSWILGLCVGSGFFEKSSPFQRPQSLWPLRELQSSFAAMGRSRRLGILGMPLQIRGRVPHGESCVFGSFHGFGRLYLLDTPCEEAAGLSRLSHPQSHLRWRMGFCLFHWRCGPSLFAARSCPLGIVRKALRRTDVRTYGYLPMGVRSGRSL